jgi:hypothetical protein
MPTLRTYRIFVSHAWKYNDEYYRLVNMLNSAPNFKWQNYSVPEHDPLGTKTAKELVEALQNQIRPTHVVLILSGMYAAHRSWIQKEIDIAVAMSKPIVGIKPWGQERIPTAVSDVADEMVGWNTSTIVAAIRRYAI